VRGDAVRLPLRDASVDAAMVAFGIRNVADPAARAASCFECAAVGAAGGARVRHARGAAAAHRVPVVLRAVLPRLAGWCRGTTTPTPIYPNPWGRSSRRRVGRMLRDAGFVGARAVRLTFGIVYLYTAGRGRDTGPDVLPTGKMGSAS